MHLKFKHALLDNPKVFLLKATMFRFPGLPDPSPPGYLCSFPHHPGLLPRIRGNLYAYIPPST